MDENTSRDTKVRQKAACDEVLRYCQNKVDCRRVQVLAFFNETFDPTNCNRGCDTCLTRGNFDYQEEDVTEDAKTMIRIMEAYTMKNMITLTNLVECYRGVAGNTVKRLSDNRYFGEGRDWLKEEAERLSIALKLQGGITEFHQSSGAGWSNSYILVRPFIANSTICAPC